MTVSYKPSRYDKAVHELVETVMSRALDLGKEMGLHHSFIYRNYAAQGQDVFSAISHESLKRLKDIQSRYDPQGIFGKLQPEHFRL